MFIQCIQVQEEFDGEDVILYEASSCIVLGMASRAFRIEAQVPA
jgi:hypothetical protein